MKPTDLLFGSDLWIGALKSYASAAHLTVKLFDADARDVFGPINPTPLFQLFEERGYDPGIFAECARRCLAQTESRPVVMVSQFYGLSVVGISLVLQGEIVGAAVGGYAFVDFSQVSEIQLLARDAGIRFERLWKVAREQKPVPQRRLILNGELLQVLGDALLRENYRTRQYEEIVLKLQETARAKDQAHQKLREQEERLLAAEKMAAAGQLAHSMAHEINNPLSSVTNVLYILENYYDLNESAHTLVTTGAAELARVARIVKQSLSYYNLGHTARDLNLGFIVDESLQAFGERFQRAGIEVKQRVRDGSEILGFPNELRQVIDNLLLNALEAMPDGGNLGISVRESFEWKHPSRKGVRLTVADSGRGIAKANRSRIFEPFFTTKAEKGNGLGLWILQGIIAQHDGSVSLRSSDIEGKSGTAISIFLPSHVRTARSFTKGEVNIDVASSKAANAVG
jgi:signal transduction histidine kinase